jgi:hypothetical protein
MKVGFSGSPGIAVRDDDRLWLQFFATNRRVRDHRG